MFLFLTILMLSDRIKSVKQKPLLDFRDNLADNASKVKEVQSQIKDDETIQEFGTQEIVVISRLEGQSKKPEPPTGSWEYGGLVEAEVEQDLNPCHMGLFGG